MPWLASHPRHFNMVSIIDSVNEQGTLDQQVGEKGPRIAVSDTASVCDLAVRVLRLAD